MNTIVATRATGQSNRALLARSYLLEAKYEFLRMLRLPSFALPTLLFPAMFYLLFGVVMGHSGRGGYQAGIYLLATYGVFGVMGPGLFGFGVAVASERERGWLTLKRALPMPPGAYLAAKLAMAMLFALVIFCVLAVLSATFGGVRLAPAQWFALLAIDVFGVLPFCAIGLFIGTRVGAQAAPAVVNLIYLPMAFLSGLWFPLFLLPGAIQKTAALWPAFHLGQLALGIVGQGGDGRNALHVAVLAGVTLLFFGLARRRLARG
ncbi:MAG: ABC transporter permease [Rhodanobacteraceae bacterium]